MHRRKSGPRSWQLEKSPHGNEDPAWPKTNTLMKLQKEKKLLGKHPRLDNHSLKKKKKKERWGGGRERRKGKEERKKQRKRR